MLLGEHAEEGQKFWTARAMYGAQLHAVNLLCKCLSCMQLYQLSGKSEDLGMRASGDLLLWQALAYVIGSEQGQWGAPWVLLRVVAHGKQLLLAVGGVVVEAQLSISRHQLPIPRLRQGVYLCRQAEQ